MLTYCWGQTRFLSFFLTHFYGFVFFCFVSGAGCGRAGPPPEGCGHSLPQTSHVRSFQGALIVFFEPVVFGNGHLQFVVWLIHTNPCFFGDSDLVLRFIAFDLLTSDIYFPSVSHTCLSAARRPCPCAPYARSWMSPKAVWRLTLGTLQFSQRSSDWLLEPCYLHNDTCPARCGNIPNPNQSEVLCFKLRGCCRWHADFPG